MQVQDEEKRRQLAQAGLAHAEYQTSDDMDLKQAPQDPRPPAR